MLQYFSLDKYNKGTIERLLVDAYRHFLEDYPQWKDQNLDSFHNCDSFFYENIEIGKKCSNITETNGTICGMICWDCREWPKAILGHNCIAESFKGKGFGREQLRNAINRLKREHYTSIYVSTGNLDFFIPAQKMYMSLGFVEYKRESPSDVNDWIPQIYYRMTLDEVTGPSL